jgi:hypothetical protein
MNNIYTSASSSQLRHMNMFIAWFFYGQIYTNYGFVLSDIFFIIILKYEFGVEEMTMFQYGSFSILTLREILNNNIHKSIDFKCCKKYSASPRDLYVCDEKMNMDGSCQNSSKL